MAKPSRGGRMSGRRPRGVGGRQGQSAGGGRRNGEKPPPRAGLKEAHAGLQPYPPKGTPNPAVGEFLSEGKIPPFPPRTDGKATLMAKPSIWRRIKLWLRGHRRDPLNLRPFPELNIWADELEDGRKLEPGLLLDRDWS